MTNIWILKKRYRKLSHAKKQAKEKHNFEKYRKIEHQQFNIQRKIAILRAKKPVK